jgi:peroxiredoxin
MNRRHLCQTALAQATLASSLSMPTWLHAQPAKTITLSGMTLDNKSYSLKQDQGKAILLFFWTTECAVCRDKLPELRTNFLGWRDKGFQLVTVNMDKSLSSARDYQAAIESTLKPGQRFPSLWRGAEAHKDNLGRAIKAPTSFVLNRKHELVKEIRGRIAPEIWDDIAELVSG